MDWKREVEILEDAIEVFGEDSQVKMAIEEMAELTVALSKYQRHIDHGQGDKDEIYQNIREEMADVGIMLAQQNLYGRAHTSTLCASPQGL